MNIMKNKDYLSEKIRWKETFDVEFPFRAVHKGVEMVLRLNDFPAEPLYTLFINGEEIVDIEDFPDNWKSYRRVEYAKSNQAAD